MQARRLYAHRGASAERPENTMPAFERAVECGVDALEMDVHLTRDGHLIVVHDPDARRMAAAPLRWNDLELAEAQRLDVGWGFVAPDGTRPFAGKGITVPRFDDVLDAFPDVRINVDIKNDLRAVGAMLAVITSRRASERVTVASFQTNIAVAVRRAGYEGETALAQMEVASLVALPGVLWRSLPFTGSAAQVPVAQGPVRFDRPAFIAKCHSIGLRVDYWVVDDPAEARRLLELGADGIMTNDPAAIRPVFEAETPRVS
ncbi:MAG: glycerophosphodiester phosphodiesterase [Myxococcales bacterium]|nr:glycerophosphodiester phosphodiesterase [Myxococcales bacterium]